jgi:hypothetical protein
MKATTKEVIEVKVGRYQMTLDEDKMSLLNNACNHLENEYRQLQELTDWLIDLCYTGDIPDNECIKYVKYLKNIRGAFDYFKSLGVTSTSQE